MSTRCDESDNNTTALARITMSLITNRPAPDSNGKPNSPLPKSGTQTSGVVTRKESVPSVMIMARVSPANSPFMSFFYAKGAPEYKEHKNAEGAFVPENRAWHEANRTYTFSYGLGAQ